MVTMRHINLYQIPNMHCHHPHRYCINLRMVPFHRTHQSAAKSGGQWQKKTFNFFQVNILIIFISLSIFRIYIENSDIFADSGNIFDVVIATMLCNGITTAQSMGIGGGFIMNIYQHDTRKSLTLDAKEVAPLAATKDMFKTRDEYVDGPLTIGVPGEVKGLWELHKRYASMPWKTLVEPTIKLCENGFRLTKHMSDFILPRLLKDNHLR